MPKLSEPEFNAFLAERQHNVRIASVDPGGQPTVLPFWFFHDGDRLYVTLRRQSAVARDIQTNPKIGCCIDEEAAPHAPAGEPPEPPRRAGRKVVIRATARIDYEPGQDGQWRDIYYAITRRYFDEDATEFYLDSTKQIARYLISIPCHYGDEGITTWGAPSEGEDAMAWWPQKYWQVTVPTGL